MLSVIINTKNSAATFRATLTSVKEMVDQLAGEIIVVDMYSQDDTVAIAEEFDARVFQHEDVGFADPAREFAFAQAQYDWLMIIDSDETAPPTLTEKIISLVHDSPPEISAYYIPRHNFIFNYGLNHTLWYPDYQLRLWRRGEIDWQPTVHSQPVIAGQVEYLPPHLEFAFVHQNYPDLDSYLGRSQKYTTFQAQKELVELDILSATASPLVGLNLTAPQKKQLQQQDFNPLKFADRFSSEFNHRFFAGQGYLDGNHGLVLSLLQAQTELLTSLKIWEQADFPHQELTSHEWSTAIKKWRQDLAYWRAELMIQANSSFLTKFIWRIRRKLKI